MQDAEYATSGTVSVNVYDPIGGVMGSYDLTFDSGDVEQVHSSPPLAIPAQIPLAERNHDDPSRFVG